MDTMEQKCGLLFICSQGLTRKSREARRGLLDRGSQGPRRALTAGGEVESKSQRELCASLTGGWTTYLF